MELEAEDMSVKVLGVQNNIFGQQDTLIPGKEETKVVAAKKPYRNISIMDGNDEKYVADNYMLLLRSVQKRAAEKEMAGAQKELLLQLLYNEIHLKQGTTDILSATRDSLLQFFCRTKA
jgi:hypothetical protein